jgi:hypothetical protein
LFQAHEPYPAIAIDADENIVAMNRSTELMLRAFPPELVTPPINAMRLAMHPEGMASHVVNLAEWRGYLLARLRRQIAHSGRESLRALYQEVAAYPCPGATPELDPPDGVVAYLHLRTLGTELRLFGTVTTFGATTDIRLAELSLEFFHPADEHTKQTFYRVMAGTDALAG